MLKPGAFENRVNGRVAFAVLECFISQRGNGGASALDKIRIFDDQHQTLLRSLFQIYSENTQEELHKMRDLIQDGRADLLRKKAHMLKSSAAQLGAFRFEKFCVLMEHEDNLDHDRARKLHAEMCFEYENSRKKFSEYCQNVSQTSNVLN